MAAAALGVTVAAWALYAGTLAPGLTWAHHGADGGDLLAAAVGNGVAHPSGYPLYALLLQGWLAAGRGLGVASPAWLGNLFSALAAGLSAGVTVVVASRLLDGSPRRTLWALVAGVTWAVTPLLWSQALITEVYALHALLVVLMGMVTFGRGARPLWVGVLVGLGLAHHLTTVLLWPALAYSLLARGVRSPALLRVGLVAGAVAALAYARIPLVAGLGPPPVNWGYATDWAGFWWLVSGEAYRGYLFALSPTELAGRLVGVGRTLVEQVTPVGLMAVIAGAMQWERSPGRRTAALLWALLVSLYAAAYATVDSQVYLLPVAWLVVLWMALGLAAADRALAQWGSGTRLGVSGVWWRRGLAGLVCAGLIGVAIWRGPSLSLRQDDAAMRYLAEVGAVLAPGSLVISSADAPTFALWYGVWASGELAETAPDLVLINAALFEFGWYRRLMHDLYPHVVGVDDSLAQVVAASRGVRPIFFTEAEWAAQGELVPVGPLWRLADP